MTNRYNEYCSGQGQPGNTDYGIQNAIVSFVWNIADDVLGDVHVRGRCRDVIFPMTVLRCLDALLKPDKETVLKMKNDAGQNDGTVQYGRSEAYADSAQ